MHRSVALQIASPRTVTPIDFRRVRRLRVIKLAAGGSHIVSSTAAYWLHWSSPPMKQIVFLSAILCAACGGHSAGDIDEVIGDTCIDDRDCADRCYRDSDFPGGFCSRPCVSDRDCPSDTYCMSTNGGVCMFACDAIDCDRLGPDWQCRSKSRVGGGDISVCSGD
jgi:hypothetical protein